MTEHIARFKPGQNLPVHAETQILAGRFVALSATKNAYGAYDANHAGVGAAADGVSEADSAPTTFPEHSTDRLVNIVRGDAVAMVVAKAAITAGAEVQVSSDAGKAITQTTGKAVGRALTAATGDNDVIEVLLYPKTGKAAAASANIADVAALTGGESPTEAEFNALVTTVNSIIAVLEAHGLAATS